MPPAFEQDGFATCIQCTRQGKAGLATETQPLARLFFLARFFQCRQGLPMASAQRNLLAGNQGHQIFAAERSPEFVNAAAINDDGTVNANKELAWQSRRECRQLLAHQILLRSRVYTNVVSRCLKALNFVQWNKDGSAVFFERQPSTSSYRF